MLRDLKRIDEQVMVITGASSGIGLLTAKRAAERGAKVVLISRDEEDLSSAVADIREAGGQATHAVADVADREALSRAAELAIEAYGRIDTWVNNAGVSMYGRIREVTLDDARRLFDTNYWGVVNGSLVAIPHLERSGGALINVGSILSETGYPLQGHYTASKHAVKGFTDSLRIELEHESAPISVTLIEPAAIDTPYPLHARNYLDVEPKHAPPVYDPDLVAKAILESAQHPHRTVRVGGGAEMFSTTERLAPRLGDKLKAATAFAGQRSDRPARDDDTLHAPRAGDGRVRGNYPGRVMSRSAYTAMRLHPRTTMLGIAAVGVGLALAFGSRSDES
jgi:NAD(P)-dependent dehydrogenase (short-subunit alcohol dehydrogenase family)